MPPAKKGAGAKKKSKPIAQSIEVTKAAVEKEEEPSKKEEQPTEAPKPEVPKPSEKKETLAPQPSQSEKQDEKSTISLKKKEEEAKEKNVQLAPPKTSSDQQVSLNKQCPSEVKKVLTIAKHQTAAPEAPKITPSADTMIISLKSKPAEIASALLEKADAVPSAEETLPQDLQSLS